MIFNFPNYGVGGSSVIELIANGTTYKISEAQTVDGVFKYAVSGTTWELAMFANCTLKLPNKMKTIEAFLVGGGAGGRKNASGTTSSTQSCGGGGGEVKTIASYSANPEETIVIGAAGAGAKSGDFGASGGDTTAFGTTAAGGKCATSGTNGGQSSATASARKGGDGTEFANSLTFAGKKFGAGGGVGQTSYYSGSGSPGGRAAGAGGTDGGGAGGAANYAGTVGAGENASFYGAGGGGGGHSYNNSLGRGHGNGGNGYQGIVIVRGTL